MQLSRSPFPGWGRGHGDVRTKSSSHRPLPLWPDNDTAAPGTRPLPSVSAPHSHFADLRYMTYMTIKQFSWPVNPLPLINCAILISKDRVN